MRHEGLLHVKKAQFLARADCRNILMKVAEAAKPDMTILCERGSAFGYGNLVVDILGVPEMNQLDETAPIDATPSGQPPGAHTMGEGQWGAGHGRRGGTGARHV